MYCIRCHARHEDDMNKWGVFKLVPVTNRSVLHRGLFKPFVVISWHEAMEGDLSGLLDTEIDGNYIITGLCPRCMLSDDQIRNMSQEE